MIAFLRGRILEKQPSRVIVDVSGVGYDVSVPLSTFYVAGDPGAEIALLAGAGVDDLDVAIGAPKERRDR